MKWFKHFTRAHRDRAIEKLILEFGVEGYGLYFYCLEVIAGGLEADRFTFELEPDAEILAYRLKMDTIKVERIMHRCIELDLFGIADSGRINCLKLAKFLEQSQTGNREIRAILSRAKALTDGNSVADGWQTGGSSVADGCPEERRGEERRREECAELNAQKSPIQPQPIGVYPAAILKAWTNLGDRVIQPASEIAWLNTFSRDISPYTMGIHSDDVLAAIDNFGKILGKPETYWQGKVTAGAWFSRHLEKFLPRNFNPRDFRKWDADGEPEEDFETRMKRIRGKGATA